MRMDFHKFSNYSECPRKYKWRDERKPVFPPKNSYYAVAGELVQKFFEEYSNSWKKEGRSFSIQDIKNVMRCYWEHLLLKNFVDWNDFSSKLNEMGLFTECCEIIKKNLDILDVYEGTRSEVKIEIKLRTGDTLVGVLDFINKSGKEASIWDGKNSNKIGKYVDEKQLLFYALLFKFHYGVLPKELAFLYFKHTKLVPIPFTEKDIDDTWMLFILVMTAIKNDKEFKPTPCAKACRLCDYLNQCPEGQEDMDSRKRGPKVYSCEEHFTEFNEDGVFTIKIGDLKQ